MSAFATASSTLGKLVGLFAFGRDDGVVLMLPRCRDIHTAGMRAPIDVAFVDARGIVLLSVRGLGAWRRVRCPGAVAVLERYADSGAPWPSEGSWVGTFHPEAAEVLESCRIGGRGASGKIAASALRGRRLKWKR